MTMARSAGRWLRVRLLLGGLVARLPAARRPARPPGRARRRPLVPADPRPRRPGPAQPAPGGDRRSPPTGAASDRVRAAATDPRALERLVRARLPPRRPLLPRGRAAAGAARRGHRPGRRHRDARGRRRGVHAGPAARSSSASTSGRIELPGALPRDAASGRPWRRWRRSTTPTCRPGSSGRAARSASGIVGLREARRELLAALRDGTSVGLVGDRDLTGGGTPDDAVRRAGPLPLGPAMLAVESRRAGATSSAARRVGIGRYRGRLERVHGARGGHAARAGRPRRWQRSRRVRARHRRTRRSSGGPSSSRSGPTSRRRRRAGAAADAASARGRTP